MNLIKVKYLRNGVPSGNAYTFETPVPVEVGNLVQTADGSICEVVQTDVPVSEVALFRNRLKSIVGIAKSADDEATDPSDGASETTDKEKSPEWGDWIKA